MWMNKVTKLTDKARYLMWMGLLFAPAISFAAPEDLGLQSITNGDVSLPSMLVHLMASIPSLTLMVTGITYMSGMAFMMGAVFQLRKYGEGVSMVSQRDIRGPLIGMAMGATLLFLPSTINTLLMTVYGSHAITGYAIPDGIPSAWPSAWVLGRDLIVVFIQFIGLVAIVRGLFHLHKSANGQSQQNGFAKGVVHLIGGVLSMNIIEAKNILYATLGLMT
jgi:uncharacterized membrane protein HdeD (DUF308 family)